MHALEPTTSPSTFHDGESELPRAAIAAVLANSTTLGDGRRGVTAIVSDTQDCASSATAAHGSTSTIDGGRSLTNPSGSTFGALLEAAEELLRNTLEMFAAGRPHEASVHLSLILDRWMDSEREELAFALELLLADDVPIRLVLAALSVSRGYPRYVPIRQQLLNAARRRLTEQRSAHKAELILQGLR